jgi:hypothetical protein
MTTPRSQPTLFKATAHFHCAYGTFRCLRGDEGATQAHRIEPFWTTVTGVWSQVTKPLQLAGCIFSSPALYERHAGLDARC